MLWGRRQKEPPNPILPKRTFSAPWHLSLRKRLANVQIIGSRQGVHRPKVHPCLHRIRDLFLTRRCKKILLDSRNDRKLAYRLFLRRQFSSLGARYARLRAFLIIDPLAEGVGCPTKKNYPDPHGPPVSSNPPCQITGGPTIHKNIIQVRDALVPGAKIILIHGDEIA